MRKVNTVIGTSISDVTMYNYFNNLVNQFFKILPMRENNEESLCTYIRSLQSELIGCKSFIPEVKENSMYATLLFILQYLFDNIDCPIKDVKREVFRAISICNKLQAIYSSKEV